MHLCNIMCALRVDSCCSYYVYHYLAWHQLLHVAEDEGGACVCVCVCVEMLM